MRSIGHTLPISDLLEGKILDPEKSLTSQVFSILKELIITIQLYPGQRLSEKEVAEALMASKTPVREAMIRLQSVGLVSIVPKRGTFVTPIQIDRYVEACFIRLQLEIGAVRRAAQQRGNWNIGLQMDKPFVVKAETRGDIKHLEEVNTFHFKPEMIKVFDGDTGNVFDHPEGL